MFKKALFIFILGLICFSSAHAQVLRAIQQRRGTPAPAQTAPQTQPPTVKPTARTEDALVAQATDAPRPIRDFSHLGIRVDAPPPLSFYRDQLQLMLRFGATFDKPYIEMIDKDPSRSQEIFNEAMANVTWPSDQITEKQLVTFFQGTFREIEEQTGIPVQIMNEQMKNPETEEDQARRFELQERYRKLFGRGEGFAVE